jgi:RimJ/RimL family protein N-acetyltransferase
MKVRQLYGVDIDQLMIIAFKEDHLTSILAEIEPGQEARHIKTAEARFRYGPAFTFIYKGEIIACCGVTIYWEGMGEVWLATSSRWGKLAKSAVIWTRDILDYLQDNWKLRRIQADVDAENETACRFIEHYGFVREGLMRKYDSLGRDMVRYARIREEWNGEPR